ncbi:MAG: hypothetical protein FWF00_04150 [Endomicrobia bacterium]|nr:hypothetical protein [Endomicrobiia bacterium]MCL2506862.1 hypothetical protein [Endomicrobiia bacterium]
MKKVLLACFAFVFAVSGVQAVSLIPKISADIPATMSYEYGPDMETKLGFSIALDIRNEISDYFSWDAGVEYNLPRGLVNVNGKSNFSFLPIYASLLFTPLKTYGDGYVKPYFKASIGYSILATNAIGDSASGGLYYGGGVGTEYRNFVIEVTGSHYSGRYKNPDTINLTYKKISITVGYKFDLSKSDDDYDDEDYDNLKSESNHESNHESDHESED